MNKLFILENGTLKREIDRGDLFHGMIFVEKKPSGIFSGPYLFLGWDANLNAMIIPVQTIRM